MKSAIYGAAVLAAVASAAPLTKRADDIDVTILQYALTLEHLENAFYKEALAKYTAADFKKAGITDERFMNRITKVAADEADHVAFLTTALKGAGQDPTKPCTYTFPHQNAAQFVALASVIEGVGVSAYLGAAGKITNKDYLTAAGSILTVEARHNALLRADRGQSPYPTAYDIPLGFNQVYSLAAPFIKVCPSTNPTLPVRAFPTMAYTGPTTALPGKKVSFKLPDSFEAPANTWIAFPAITGPMFAKATIANGVASCTLPAQSQAGVGPAGQTYAYLTSSGTELTDDNTLAQGGAFNTMVQKQN